MLEIKNLRVSYEKDKPVLQDICLNVKKGEIVGLVGMNGAGKSTLMRTISGVIPYESGNITINGIEQMKLGAGRRQVSYLKAEDNLYNELSVLENMKVFCSVYKVPRNVMLEIAERLECTELFAKKAGELSTGLRQRVAVACSTMAQFDLLLLDEPTNGLDIEAKRYIVDYIKTLSTNKNGIIITSHNIKDIEDLSDRIYILREGRIIKEATAHEIMNESAQKNSQWCIEVKKSDRVKEIAKTVYGTYFVGKTEESYEIFVPAESKQYMMNALVMNDIEIVSVHNVVDNLEDAILEVVRN